MLANRWLGAGSLACYDDARFAMVNVNGIGCTAIPTSLSVTMQPELELAIATDVSDVPTEVWLSEGHLIESSSVEPVDQDAVAEISPVMGATGNELITLSGYSR
jgi:hypothetical protein